MFDIYFILTKLNVIYLSEVFGSFSIIGSELFCNDSLIFSLQTVDWCVLLTTDL